MMGLRNWLKRTNSKLMVALAGLTMMLGVGVAINTAVASQENEVVETKAAASSTVRRLFLFTNNLWEDATPTVKVRCYNTSTSTNDYYVATKIKDYYYYCDVETTNHNGYEFQRFSTDGSEFWNGYSTYCTSTYNFCSLTGYSNSSTWGTRLPYGQSIYLDIDSYSWTSDSHVICAYFWNGSENTKIQGTMVQGWDNYNTHLYEFVVPAADTYVFWTNVLFYRSTSVSGSWSNQTGDLSYDYSNNVCKLTGWSSGSYNWNYLDSSRGDALGIYIRDQLAAICSNYAENTASSFTTAWANCKAQFDSTNSAVQELFQTASKSATSTDYLGVAAGKYDYCVSKYSLTDWANRKNGGNYSGASVILPRAISQDSPATVTLWIVIGCGIAGLIGIGSAYFINKKKKKA